MKEDRQTEHMSGVISEICISWWVSISFAEVYWWLHKEHLTEMQFSITNPFKYTYSIPSGFSAKNTRQETKRLESCNPWKKKIENKIKKNSLNERNVHIHHQQCSNVQTHQQPTKPCYSWKPINPW